jgi:uncharacterized protein (TIGR03435 family)
MNRNRTIALGALTAVALVAQTQSKTFEVATVKPSAGPGGAFLFRGDRMIMNGLSLRGLAAEAYSTQAFMVSGGPSWVDADRWDIEAKASGGGRIRVEEVRLMLQQLLEERFQLKLRRESKEVQIYALVVGKNGAKLPAAVEGQRLPDRPGMPPQPAALAGRPFVRTGRGFMEGTNAHVEDMLRNLALMLQRPVVDKTGLAGAFDFHVEWSPEPALGGLPGDPPPADAAPALGDSGPTIFTAFQEQLGLRFDSQRAPMEVFVIEKAEKPTEN